MYSHTSLRDLWDFFDELEVEPSVVLGLAHEQQPTYLEAGHCNGTHDSVRAPPIASPTYPLVWAPLGTNVTALGSPDLPGFNGGVQLQHLARMRLSDAYQSALGPTAVNRMVSTRLLGIARGGGFARQGCDLGDQDIYSLLALDSPGMFFALPCQWHRQACTHHEALVKKRKWCDKKTAEQYHACPAGDAAGPRAVQICHQNGGGQCGLCPPSDL